MFRGIAGVAAVKMRLRVPRLLRLLDVAVALLRVVDIRAGYYAPQLLVDSFPAVVGAVVIQC